MTNNKQQTAVEWLIKELGEYFPHGIGGIEYMVKQAKEMEKEQHKNTWYDSRLHNYIGKQKSFEDFYNETYGK